jgi:hypothetical protein
LNQYIDSAITGDVPTGNAGNPTFCSKLGECFQMLESATPVGYRVLVGDTRNVELIG